MFSLGEAENINIHVAFPCAERALCAKGDLNILLESLPSVSKTRMGGFVSSQEWRWQELHSLLLELPAHKQNSGRCFTEWRQHMFSLKLQEM